MLATSCHMIAVNSALFNRPCDDPADRAKGGKHRHQGNPDQYQHSKVSTTKTDHLASLPMVWADDTGSRPMESHRGLHCQPSFFDLANLPASACIVFGFRGHPRMNWSFRGDRSMTPIAANPMNRVTTNERLAAEIAFNRHMIVCPTASMYGCHLWECCRAASIRIIERQREVLRTIRVWRIIVILALPASPIPNAIMRLVFLCLACISGKRRQRRRTSLEL